MIEEGLLSTEAFLFLNLSFCFQFVGISLPTCWTPMPRQRNGNEVTVHTVRLASHSSEFLSVVQQFQKTAGAVAITSIERIQNPLLYQAYQLRKQKMDIDNGGNNERQLFHGTASGNAKKINSQGFNRNFSGAAHGKQRLIKALISALRVASSKRSAS